MASRIVFLPKHIYPWYEEKIVNFEWVPGLAISQAQKSIFNLHEEAKKQLNLHNILEVSTKANSDFGVSLSAFNLKMKTQNSFESSVESIYQSSKNFEHGGPFIDIMQMSPSSAKKDERLKSSGKLIGFSYNQNNWKVTFSPNFYDFLYITALVNFDKRFELNNFDGFTDIAFNQTSTDFKINLSFNCQARSVSIYLGLLNSMPESEILGYLFQLTQDNNKEITQEQLSLDF